MFSPRGQIHAWVRDLSGEIHSKTVQISVKTKAGAEKKYNVFFKRYVLKDQTGKPIMAAG
jgi:hypothetical protein